MCAVYESVSIAGVDFGATSAIAILDFSGGVLLLKSQRGFREHEILRELSKASPCIVACDARPSRAIRRIARALGARLWFPRRALRLEEKMNLTRRFAFRNAHERDALASALKAYGSIVAKIRAVKARARRLGLSDEATERAIVRVLRGERMAVAIGAQLQQHTAFETQHFKAQ